MPFGPALFLIVAAVAGSLLSVCIVRPWKARGHENNRHRLSQRFATQSGELMLSITEADGVARFRLIGTRADAYTLTTIRDDCTRQIFPMIDRQGRWESLDAVPKPFRFSVAVTVESHGKALSYHTAMRDDSFIVRPRAETAMALSADYAR